MRHCAIVIPTKGLRLLKRAVRSIIRLLPRACPELNAADLSFRSVKGRGVSNRQTCSINSLADAACRYLYKLSRQERLQVVSMREIAKQFSSRVLIAGDLSANLRGRFAAIATAKLTREYLPQ